MSPIRSLAEVENLPLFGLKVRTLDAARCAVIFILRKLPTTIGCLCKDVIKNADKTRKPFSEEILDVRRVISVESHGRHFLSMLELVFRRFSHGSLIRSSLASSTATSTSCANRKSDYVRKFLAVFFFFFFAVFPTSSYKIRKRFEVQPIFTMFDFSVSCWS